MRSLHRRFVLTSVISISLCIALASAALVQVFAENYSQRVQQELSGHVKRLAAIIRFSPDGRIHVPGSPEDNRFLVPYSGLYWQINDPSNNEVLRSASLFDYLLPLPDDEQPVSEVHQYRLEGPEGKDVLVQERVLLLAAPEGKRPLRFAVAVNAAEVDGARKDFAFDIAPYIAVLAVLLIIMSIGQLWVVLRPLDRISRDLEALRDRKTGKLTSTYPREIQPLADRLNMLLESQASAIEKARGRAGDLAHGLKTPLTVLINNALTLREKGEVQIADELDQLADTMLAHVEHELTRARITPAPDQRTGDADVGKIVGETIYMLQHTHAGECLTWEADIPSNLTVPIDPHDFREIAGNLLQNASKWAKSRVIVSACLDDSQYRLIVEDDGPGVRTEHLSNLKLRGVRFDRSKAGSGLGLAIVSEIAEVYGLTLSLRNRESGGFHAEVAGPARAPHSE